MFLCCHPLMDCFSKLNSKLDLLGGIFHPKTNISFSEDSECNSQLSCIRWEESLEAVLSHVPRLCDMDMAQIPEHGLEEQMWQTLFDQEILPVTAATSTDMEITSPVCAEMSSQGNIGKEYYLLGFGQDLQNNIVADLTPGCAEHLISPADDASVFQNLKHLIYDSENAQEKSLIMTSTSLSENYLDLPVKTQVSPVSPYTGKEIMEPEQQDSLMEFFNLSAEQMDHCEEFHDLNLLLEQVATHDVMETVTIPTQGEIISPVPPAGGPESSILSSNSEQDIDNDSSKQSTKKQRRLSTIINEDSCEVSSTQNAKPKLTPKTTHQKYMEMRRKNNIASRRSRQIRKDKDKAMETTVIELENENRVLKEKADRLEKQRDALKNFLMTLITSQSLKA